MHLCVCSEEATPEGIVAAYTQLWGVVKLPAVMRLSGILVSMRLAFLCVESVASLKLIEKGVAKVCKHSMPSVCRSDYLAALLLVCMHFINWCCVFLFFV